MPLALGLLQGPGRVVACPASPRPSTGTAEKAWVLLQAGVWAGAERLAQSCCLPQLGFPGVLRWGDCAGPQVPEQQKVRCSNVIN